MNNVSLSNLSRRRFIAAAGLGAATAVFAPRFLFAQETYLASELSSATDGAALRADGGVLSVTL